MTSAMAIGMEEIARAQIMVRGGTIRVNTQTKTEKITMEEKSITQV